MMRATLVAAYLAIFHIPLRDKSRYSVGRCLREILAIWLEMAVDQPRGLHRNRHAGLGPDYPSR